MRYIDSPQFHRIAKALAEPRRFEIFELIAGHEELSCGEIAERFPVAQPTVSHHLKVLTDAQLIAVRREGQHAYFSARRDVLAAYIADLERRTAAAVPLRKRAGESR